MLFNELEQQGWTEAEAEKQQPDRKAKTGPRNYSKQKKIAAVIEWDDRDRDLHPEKLHEYLERKFGTSPGGIPNVAESTFHGWRKLAKLKS